eukprot:scaffold7548_cov277-Pinguiococcus_pyrenoidosus.AAC.2
MFVECGVILGNLASPAVDGGCSRLGSSLDDAMYTMRQVIFSKCSRTTLQNHKGKKKRAEKRVREATLPSKPRETVPHVA